MAGNSNLAVKILISAKDSASSVIGTLTGSVAKLTAGIAAAGTAIAGWAGAALFGDAVTAAEDLQTQMGKLQGAIDATGGAAGLTAAELDEMARRLDEATLGSAAGFRDAAAELLTFKSVGKDVFERTLALSQDLASTGFGSVESAAVMMGKALEDPVRGLTALRRVGVSFTADQEALIKALAETGQVAAAQGLILDAVAGQVGGVASSMGAGLAGAVDLVGKRFTDLKELLGEAMVPVLIGINNRIAELYKQLNESGAVSSFGSAIAEVFNQAWQAAQDFIDKIDFKNLAAQVADFASTTKERLNEWGEALRNAWSVADTAMTGIGVAWNSASTLIHGAAAAIAKAIAIPMAGYAKLVEVAARLGLVSQETADTVRNAADSMRTSADANYQAMVDGAGKVGAGLKKLAGEQDQTAASAKKLAAAQEDVVRLTPAQQAALNDLESAQAAYNMALEQAQQGSAEAVLSLELLGGSVDAAQSRYDALTRSATAAAPAVAETGDVAKDIRTPLEQASQQINALEIAYQAFMSVGDIQGAARIRSQIEGITESLKGAGDQAGKTAAEVIAAFARMGLKTKDQLAQTAEQAQSDFSTIAASGQAAPKQIQDAFTRYAEASIAANDGVVGATLQADAAQQGLVVSVSETGNVIVQSTADAAKAQQQLGDQTQQTADYTQTFGNEVGSVSDNLLQFQDGADGASDSTQKLTETVEQNVGAMNWMMRAIDGAIDSIRNYSESAAEAVDAIIQSVDSWNAKLAQIAKLDASSFGAEATEIGALKDEIAGLAQEAEAATTEAARLKNAWDGAFNWFGPFYEGLGVIKDFEAQVIGAQVAQKRLELQAAELGAALDDLSSSFDQGDLGLADYIAKLEQLQRQYAALGDERLDGLRDALADAKREMADFAESAQEGLQSLQQEWADLNDQQIQSLMLEQQMERVRVETELAQAKRDNNAEAIAALTQQLALLDQIHRKQLDNLAEEEAAQAIADAEAAAREAERRTGLTDEARQYEDMIAGLQDQLADALLANNTALEQQILDQIAAEKARHALYLANLDTERKAREAADKAAAQTATGTTTQAAASATTQPVKTVEIKLTSPSGKTSRVHVLPGEENALEAFLRELESGKAVYQ